MCWFLGRLASTSSNAVVECDAIALSRRGRGLWKGACEMSETLALRSTASSRGCIDVSVRSRRSPSTCASAARAVPSMNVICMDRAIEEGSTSSKLCGGGGEREQLHARDEVARAPSGPVSLRNVLFEARATSPRSARRDRGPRIERMNSRAHPRSRAAGVIASGSSSSLHTVQVLVDECGRRSTCDSARRLVNRCDQARVHRGLVQDQHRPRHS